MLLSCDALTMSLIPVSISAPGPSKLMDAVSSRLDAVHLATTLSILASNWIPSSAGNDTPSPTTSAAFTIGPITEADWEGSVWLGGGQNEFKLTYSLDAVSAAAGASIFVASPGGAVVYSQSQIEKTRDWIWTVVGDDEIGLSPWIDFRKTVSYQGYTIPLGLSQEQQQQQVKLQIGAGFWSPEYQLGNPFWGKGVGSIYPYIVHFYKVVCSCLSICLSVGARMRACSMLIINITKPHSV